MTDPGLSHELDIFSQPAPVLDFEFNIEVQAIERGCWGPLFAVSRPPPRLA